MSCSDFVKADSTTESFQDELMEDLTRDLTLEDETFEEGNVVILGVCAMNKKVLTLAVQFYLETSYSY